MQACTIISSFKRPRVLPALAFFLLTHAAAYAQETEPGPEAAPPPVVAPKREEANLFDTSTPYLDYADFNLNEEEAEDTNYFQYGRYFGLSLGLGYQTATGNRGKLYNAALPRFDARIQYWFGFNFAADMGIFFADHSYFNGSSNTKVKLLGYGFHLKYYFDVKDASAPVSFANPHLIGGVGVMSKSETTPFNSATPDTDSSFSVDFGGGLEFPIVYKKTYFALECLYHTQSFADTEDDNNPNNLPDRSGGFLTLLGHFMFVW
jgi:hypothetical protein